MWDRLNETALYNTAITNQTKFLIDSMRPRSTKKNYHKSFEILDRRNKTAQYKKSIMEQTKYGVKSMRP